MEIKKKDMPINLADKVTVIATNKAKKMIAGKEYQVQKQLAETLVKEGKVTIKK